MDKEKIIEEIYKVQSRLETLFADIQDDLDNLKDEIKEEPLQDRLLKEITRLQQANITPVVIYMNKSIYEDFYNDVYASYVACNQKVHKVCFNDILVCPVCDTEGRDFLIGI